MRYIYFVSVSLMVNILSYIVLVSSSFDGSNLIIKSIAIVVYTFSVFSLDCNNLYSLCLACLTLWHVS